MESKKILVSLVALVAFAVLFVSSASAFATIDSVEVSGIEALNGSPDITVVAGETVPVRVIFTGTADATDVRVKAEISGSDSVAAVTSRFIVDDGDTYSRLLAVNVPFDIDSREPLTLTVTVESKNAGVADSATISLVAKRESYLVEVLDVAMDNTVSAGSNLVADIVLKNRGREFAEDTFVRMTIPALSVETRAYFGDLSPEDQPFSEDPFVSTGNDRIEKEDAGFRRLSLKVPQGTPAGIYTVQFEAFNSDSSTTITKKVAIVGPGADSKVVSTSTSKTIAVGEKGAYAVTVVNTGSNTMVYDISFESPSGITLGASESVFAVPAGTSKTVTVEASANEAGTYSFAVNVNSNGELVKKESFEAKINGTSKGAGADATVVLTVILAIIFVVLLVVLIVLLTRKPQKSE